MNPSFAKVLLQVLCLRVLLRKTAEVESYISEMTASFPTTRFEVTPAPRSTLQPDSGVDERMEEGEEGDDFFGRFLSRCGSSSCNPR